MENNESANNSIITIVAIVAIAAVAYFAVQFLNQRAAETSDGPSIEVQLPGGSSAESDQ